MTDLTFKHLNHGWNAEPNAPEERVSVSGDTVHLTFYLNPWAYAAEEEERATLSFGNCSAWRLGGTNDEGWYKGQCRYSGIAPAWGEFYEISGQDARQPQPDDWHLLAGRAAEPRHFLFYLRDCTFECFAAGWRLERNGPAN